MQDFNQDLSQCSFFLTALKALLYLSSNDNAKKGVFEWNTEKHLIHWYDNVLSALFRPKTLI